VKKYQLIGLLSVLAVICLIVETTIINVPFVFVLSVIMAFYFNKSIFYFGAFILGFFIDSLRVSNFGLTALFVFAVILAIFLYEKMSGSRDKVVAAFFITVALLIYTYFLGYSMTLVVSMIVLFVATVLGYNFLKYKKIL